jgi:hypothetical protein
MAVKNGWGTYRGDLSALESADNAVDLELAVDIGLLLLLDDGSVDVGRHDDNGRANAVGTI